MCVYVGHGRQKGYVDKNTNCPIPASGIMTYGQKGHKTSLTPAEGHGSIST